MRYRRERIPGGTYFFTLVTHERRAIFSADPAVQALRDSLHHVARKHPFTTLAYVLLPDHLHVIWRLPPNDDDYPLRWRLVKHGVSTRLGPGIWQPRYWEHRIRDEADFERHADYIHFNPVKHGLVTNAQVWPHSSLRVYVERGDYAPDWGKESPAYEGQFGE